MLDLPVDDGPVQAPPLTRQPTLARPLTLHDLPALTELESEKWEPGQAASPDDLAGRIAAFPELSIGAFCPRTGIVLASLFMKPVAPDFWTNALTWHACVASPSPRHTSALFGISLSSRDAAGVKALIHFFHPRALASGWRHIYLGSPVPGWRDWHDRWPARPIEDYVSQKGPQGLPLDPQLRYYHARGFTEVMGTRRDYFFHERSQHHGVMLRGTVPSSMCGLEVVQDGSWRRGTGGMKSVPPDGRVPAKALPLARHDARLQPAQP